MRRVAVGTSAARLILVTPDDEVGTDELEAGTALA